MAIFKALLKLAGMNGAACSAMALAAVYQGIGFVIGVAERAMRYFRRIRSDGSDRRSIAVATSQVLLETHYFHMCRIHAAPDTAKMIQLHAGWYSANEQFISDPMCGSRAVLKGLAGVKPKDSVTVMVQLRSPKPASRKRISAYVAHESVNDIYRSSSASAAARLRAPGLCRNGKSKLSAARWACLATMFARHVTPFSRIAQGHAASQVLSWPVSIVTHHNLTGEQSYA